MPRHTQPREVAELKGAVAHDPQRYRNNPPKSKLPLGNAPDWMDEAEAMAWVDFCTHIPPGVLTETDRMTLEMGSVLMAEFRELRRDFKVSKVAQLISIFGRFGMTPADRQKLHVEKIEDEQDGFVKL